jgi:hypothetical protein
MIYRAILVGWESFGFEQGFPACWTAILYFGWDGHSCWCNQQCLPSPSLSQSARSLKWRYLYFGDDSRKCPFFVHVHGDVILVHHVTEAYLSGNELLGILDILWQRKDVDYCMFKIFSDYCL